MQRNLTLVRQAITLACAKGSRTAAHQLAIDRYGSHDAVTAIAKAAVAAGTTTDATWAQPLVRAANVEFAEALRPVSAVSRMRQVMRRVPFDIRSTSATSGAGATWVGENRFIPVGRMSLSEIVTLRVFKLGVILIETDELARFAGEPGNEAIFTRDMVAAVAQGQDQAFFSAAAGTTESAAGILHGITPIASSGSDVASIVSDLEQLFTQLTNTGILLIAPYLIASPKVCVQLALKRGPDGSVAFPGVTVAGGELAGVPLLACASVPSDSAGDSIVLVDAAEVLIADDDVTEVDVSRHATLQLDDAPVDDASAVVRSMYQENCVAIRALRHVNWLKRRPQVAAWINGINYSSALS